MSLPVRLILALGSAGTLLFIVRAVTSVLERRNSTRIALAQAVIAEQQKLAARATLKERLRSRLNAAGYAGTLDILLIAFTLLILTTTLGFLAVGLGRLASPLLAVPSAALVLWLAAARWATKRKKAFDEQLLAALTMIAGQLESGVGIQRALAQVASASPEPLSSELRAAIDASMASRNLTGSLTELRDRYPSRSFDLFLAALAIDQQLGAKMEPALRQAAEQMSREFELRAEANAEVAQARVEFYGVIALMAIIAAAVSFSSTATLGDALTNPLGAIIIAAGAGNFVLGIVRARRLLNRIEQREQSLKAPETAA